MEGSCSLKQPVRGNQVAPGEQVEPGSASTPVHVVFTSCWEKLAPGRPGLLLPRFGSVKKSFRFYLIKVQYEPSLSSTPYFTWVSCCSSLYCFIPTDDPLSRQEEQDLHNSYIIYLGVEGSRKQSRARKSRFSSAGTTELDSRPRNLFDKELIYSRDQSSLVSFSAEIRSNWSKRKWQKPGKVQLKWVSNSLRELDEVSFII